MKIAEAYIPTPPSITYWTKVAVVTLEGEREVYAPTTRPLANVNLHLFDDADIKALLDALAVEATRRCLTPALSPLP